MENKKVRLTAHMGRKDSIKLRFQYDRYDNKFKQLNLEAIINSESFKEEVQQELLTSLITLLCQNPDKIKIPYGLRFDAIKDDVCAIADIELTENGIIWKTPVKSTNQIEVKEND